MDKVICPHCGKDASVLIFLIICGYCHRAMTPQEYEFAWIDKEKKEQQKRIKEQVGGQHES